MRASYLRLGLIVVLCLCFFACGGGGGGSTGEAPASNESLVTVDSNEFVLNKRVLILGSDVTVVSVEENSVTLGGNVPELLPGSIIIKNEGELIFERKVVSSQRIGAEVLVQTLPVSIAEIYDSANIQQTEVISPEVLAQLEPAVPGLSVSTAVQGKHEAGGLETSVNIDFDQVPVKADDGRIIGTLTGTGTLLYGFEAAVVIKEDPQVAGGRVATLSLVPFSHCHADVTFTGEADVEGGGTVDLFKPATFHLGQLGEITPVVNTRLFLRWKGRIETPCVFRVSTGPEGVQTKLGQRYVTGYPDINGNLALAFIFSSIEQIDEFSSDLTGEILKAPESDIDFDLRLLEIQSDVTKTKFAQSIPDFPQPIVIKDISIRQDVLRVHVTSAFESSTLLKCKLEQLYRWTSNQQWTSYAVTQNNNAVVDVTDQVGKDRSYFQGPERAPRLLQETSVPDPIVPVSLTIPQLVNPGRLMLGKTVDLTVVGGYTQGERFRPAVGIWTSSDPNVVEILRPRARTTTLRARTAGTAIITCTHPSGISTQGILTVVPPSIDEITVRIREAAHDPLIPEPEAPSPFDGPPVTFVSEAEVFKGPLRPGELFALQALARWSDGTVQDVTQSALFAIEDNGVATLDGATLRAEFPGEVLVTATLNPDGPTIPPIPVSRKAAFGGTTFFVEYPPGSNLLLLPRDGQQIGIGATVVYRAFASLLDGAVREVTRQASYLSSDSAVASISGGGLAAGLTAGRTAIEASFGGTRTWVDLYVQDPPLTALSLQASAEIGQGSTANFRATGTFADGSSRDVTDRVFWRSVNPDVLTFGANGQATGLAPGTATVFASLDTVSATAQVTVLGPVRLVVTGQPPANGTPNSPFTVTVEVFDLQGRVASATNEITLAVAPGTSAGLSGQLVRQATNGVAVFDNLQLDAPGTGFLLLATASGLTSATTQPFNIGGGTGPVGHLFVANDNSPVGAVNSLAIDSGGIPTAVTNSPFAASGRSHAVERLSDLVVTADVVEPAGPCRLRIFQYDQATGALTNLATTAPFTANFNPLHTATNGVDALFVLAEFDATVSAIRLDPTNGNVLSSNTVPIAGGLQPNELAFRASTGGGPDLLFVLQGNGGGNNVHAFAYNNVTGQLTVGPVTGIPAGVLPGGVAVIGSRLYVTNQGPAPDTITVFDIVQATGGLNFVGTVASGGTSSGALHHLVHPVLGDMLFCANGPPDDTLGVFTINGLGQPIPLGAPVPVLDTNPHEIIDFGLGGNRFALYVTASTRLAAFLVDPVTGTLTSISGAPFTGFNSPFGIAR